MQTAPPAQVPPPPPLALAEGLALILRGLCALIAARFRVRAIAPHTGVLITYIHRLAQRFTRLMARMAEGPLPPSRPRAKRPYVPSPRTRLPRGHLWLIRAIPNEAAAYASQISHLLAQPGMAALAAQPRARRMLARLCHILGVTLPAPASATRPAPGLTPPPPDPPSCQPPAPAVAKKPA